MNTLENQIKEFLINSHLVSVWEENIEEATEFSDSSNSDDIAYTSSGIKYSKKIVFDFLKDNGSPITAENIEMVAKRFAQDGKIVVKEKKKILRSEIDEAPLSLLEQLLPLKTLQVLEEINQKISTKPIYKYGIIEIPDLPNGATDIDKLMNTIEEYSYQGWKVMHIFENKHYSASQGVSPGSFQASQQSIHGAAIVLLERKEFRY